MQIIYNRLRVLLMESNFLVCLVMTKVKIIMIILTDYLLDTKWLLLMNYFCNRSLSKVFCADPVIS